MLITIHAPGADDLSGLGLGALLPSEAIVEEEAGGMYELVITQPITDDGRHLLVDTGRIICSPAPVRETPLVQIGNAGQTVTRPIYKVTASKLNLRTKGSTSSGKIIRSYKRGTQVVKLDETTSWMKVAIKSGGATGWMHKDYLTFVKNETETIVGDSPGGVIEPRQTREQLFRVYQAKRSNTKKTVEALAQHITYDLKGVIVGSSYAPKGVAANTVCAELVSRGDHEHEFNVICTCTDPITADYTGRSVLECLLDPDDGVVAQCKARLVRDNYDIFILPDEDRELGVELRYAKNLLEAEIETDTADVITRIRPVGKKKNGDPLYITANGGYADSPRIAEHPVVYAKEIDYDVQVGQDGIGSESAARTKLAELAAKDFTENGVDAPAVKLDADFVRLELTEEYKELANQKALHLYDTARVVDGDAGIYATLRMTGYEFDAIVERYTRTDLGELMDMEPTVYGYDIAGGTLSGTRLINGTVDGGTKLRDLSIGTAKIELAAITTALIDDAAITRAKIGEAAIGEAQIDNAVITNAKIKDGEIESAKIKDATIDSAKIKDAAITTAKIYDGAITNAKIENGAIDSAKIQDATITGAKIGEAQIGTAKIALGAITTALIKTGAIGTAQIADGSITDAKIVNLNADVITTGTLSVERLLLKGADGLFHAINATDAGLTVEQLSEEEYQNQLSGTVLVAKSVTADKIAAKTITANEIASDTITSDLIDVVELFAADAVIDHLNTYDIRNDDRITLTVGGEKKTVLVLQDGEMVFGDPSSPLKTVQTGERFAVRQGGRDVSYFSGDKLWIRDAEVDNSLRFGNYYVMPASDGGVKFVRA